MPTSLLNPLPAAHRHRHGRRLLFLVSSSSSSATSTTSSLSFSSLPQTNAKSKSKLLKVKAPLLPFSSRSHRPSAMDTSCKVQIITQERFSEDVLCSDLPVLVGFCADWCGPCKLIGPILDTVSKVGLSVSFSVTSGFCSRFECTSISLVFPPL